MKNFFDLDGPLWNFTSFLTKLIGVSLLWLIACLPLVTIGAANAGFYQSVRKSIINNEGYLMPVFFKSFRQNFRLGVLGWSLNACLVILLIWDIDQLQDWTNSLFRLLVLALLLVCLAIIEGASLYFYSYISRFDDRLGRSLRNALLLSIAQFPRTVLLAGMCSIGVILCLLVPYSILIVPGIYFYFKVKIQEKAFLNIKIKDNSDH